MSATLATVETYLTAAQTAIGDSDYAEARKQCVLAQAELAKLPNSDAAGGRTLVNRATEQIQKLYDLIGRLESDVSSASSSRRTTARLS